MLIRDAAGELLGAAGVSGDTSERDEACAIHGVEAAGLQAVRTPPTSRGRNELYNLAQDPLERRNLARVHSDLCRSLRQRLAAWRDDAGRHLAEIRVAGATASGR